MNNKELKSIKPNSSKRTFTEIMCGSCKYADIPRNRKPCCSCYWLERESYYEDAYNCHFRQKYGGVDIAWQSKPESYKGETEENGNNSN